jgi:hypothetical protein
MDLAFVSKMKFRLQVVLAPPPWGRRGRGLKAGKITL